MVARLCRLHRRGHWFEPSIAHQKIRRFARLALPFELVPLGELGPVTIGQTGAPTAVATPAHEHAWELRGVEFTDGVSVEEFVCHDCAEIWFR